MKCPRCKNTLRPGALFCVRCGARFRPGEVPRAGQESRSFAAVGSSAAVTPQPAPAAQTPPGAVPDAAPQGSVFGTAQSRLKQATAKVGGAAAILRPNGTGTNARSALVRETVAAPAPAAPPQNYGAPTAPRQNYAAPDAPRQNYGAPTAPRQNYGTPTAPRQNYGTPNAPRQNYTAPAAPRQTYAAPAAPKKTLSPEERKKRKLLAAILIPAACLVLAFVVVLLTVILPNSRYDAAMELKEAGRYDEAIAAFEAMNGYKDSGAMIMDCHYEAAMELYNTGRYESAILAFEALGDYRESKSMRKDCQYFAALDLYNAGDYENAAIALKELNGYKDSDELIKGCDLAKQYESAVRLFDAGAYKQAKAAFEALGDYSDSAEQVDRCSTEIRKAATVGDIILFGSYEQDNDTYNGAEEVEWQVLEKQGDRMLLISRYALDCQLFNTVKTSVTWETSSLRAWLNDTFFRSAFSAEEQALILTSTVTADANPSFRTSPGSDTSDKVFLLSIPEATKYFAYDGIRQCEGTAYCYAQGAYLGAGNNSWWWLRSPGNRTGSAANVGSRGAVHYNGNDVDSAAGAVRPVIWITIG